jgi:molybdopterin molybdotransferase
MIDPEAAWEKLLPLLAPLPTQRLGRSEAAGRILARAVAATTDLPPCDLSALDGFALAGEPGADGRFAIAGTRLAGDVTGGPVPGGGAMRIMTGAAIPAGTDRVVGVEETSVAEGTVRVSGKVEAGAAIRRQGEIVRRGGALLPPGALLTPAALALLASQGIAEVEVHRPPRLAFLLTGDEIVPPSASPAAGQLRDSHSDFLLAELARLGLPALSLGIARDDPETLAHRLRSGLASADVVLTCGGVSMGEADFLPPVLAGLGFQTLFHGVAIQPGKPLLVAHRDRQLVFGLPGNPASVMVAYWLFVRPALSCLAGRAAHFWGSALAGSLGGPLGAGRGRDRFVPATWSSPNGEPIVDPISPKGSHDLLAFGAATALVRVGKESPARVPGERCKWIPLDA